jgi:hypothetical protein
MMTAQIKCVTCLVIGDTGAGKSEFANRYLGQSLFEANDGPMAVTAEPISHSTIVDEMTRRVIDTEGHADGNSISSVQIQKLACFCRTWKYGVNGICIVLNGQHDRFSQGIKDTIRWVYNTFGTPEVLNYICLVFTRCFDAVAFPNRQRKRIEYRRCVQQFLTEISSVSSVPEIPIFFVDSLDLKSTETEHNLIQFHGWLVARKPLSTNRIQAVALRDKVEDEFEDKFFVEYEYSGPPEDQYRSAVYEQRKRQKVTPYNSDPPRYSKWEVLRRWKENAGHQTIVTHNRVHETEDKNVNHHSGHSLAGFSSRAHTHYSIVRNIWTEQWTVTTDFDGTVTQTNPVQVGQMATRTIDSGRERGWTDRYRGKVIR